MTTKARIVLEGAHPDYPMYFGGQIEEAEDTKDNYLYKLYNRVNVIPKDETPENETSYNWWIIRRQVAWAAKVPDNDLPPVYGPSQVCDIYPYEHSNIFTIKGNSEISVGNESLDLYYRYSVDNGTADPWSEWTLFSTDKNISDGWSWEFNAPNGTGFYQFYSIRHSEFEGIVEIEKSPPGPDAIVKIV